MRPFHRARVELDYPAFLDQAEVTDQEKEVFRMLAEGWLGKEIAEALEVSCPRISQIKKGPGPEHDAVFRAGDLPRLLCGEGLMGRNRRGEEWIPSLVFRSFHASRLWQISGRLKAAPGFSPFPYPGHRVSRESYLFRALHIR